MTFIWCIVLVIYGCVIGFDNVPALCWWACVPWSITDARLAKGKL